MHSVQLNQCGSAQLNTIQSRSIQFSPAQSITVQLILPSSAKFSQLNPAKLRTIQLPSSNQFYSTSPTQFSLPNSDKFNQAQLSPAQPNSAQISLPSLAQTVHPALPSSSKLSPVQPSLPSPAQPSTAQLRSTSST